MQIQRFSVIAGDGPGTRGRMSALISHWYSANGQISCPLWWILGTARDTALPRKPTYSEVALVVESGGQSP